MRKLPLSEVFALAFLLALVPARGRAQSDGAPPASAPPASSQQPATASSSQPPTSAPAAARPPVSQVSPSAPSQALPNSSTKPAKVWTNDEIDVLHGDHGVSVVGKNGQNTGATSAKPKGYSMEKGPDWYRKQLQPLQAEIDQLNAQIEKTKAFLSGERVNDAPAATGAYYGVAGNPQDQLRKLEDRRDKDLSKVNDLLDRARHNDIPPGDLR